MGSRTYQALYPQSCVNTRACTMAAMIMSIRLPPGLEDVVPFGVPALPTPACSPNECFLSELPFWHVAQANADLLRQNAELRAQVVLMSENATLAKANARLVEQ